MKEQAKAWMEFAARDLEAARKLADDEYLANVVLFHSQQCIEKCLKMKPVFFSPLPRNCTKQPVTG